LKTCILESVNVAKQHVSDLGLELTQGRTASLIRRRVGRLVAALKLAPDAQPDLEQTLLVALLRRYPRFLPARSPWHAFAIGVLDHAVAEHLKHAGKQKRRPDRRITSLAIEVLNSAGQTTTLGETLTAEQGLRRRELDRRSDSEQFDLRHDVQLVLARLSARDRKLCAELMQDNVSQVARTRRLPRRTLRRRLQALRDQFTDAGFANG